jgi:hypothetical protein
MTCVLSAETAKWLDQKWTMRSTKGAGVARALAMRAPISC